MTGIETITLAGVLAGALDITATSTLMALQGMPLERLWQGIASGALGAIYYAMSLKLPILIEKPILCGTLYGIIVHVIMSRIVAPLSAAPKREFSLKAFLTQLVIHICFVGLPIALTVTHFSQ